VCWLKLFQGSLGDLDVPAHEEARLANRESHMPREANWNGRIAAPLVSEYYENDFGGLRMVGRWAQALRSLTRADSSSHSAANPEFPSEASGLPLERDCRRPPTNWLLTCRRLTSVLDLIDFATVLVARQSRPADAQTVAKSATIALLRAQCVQACAPDSPSRRLCQEFINCLLSQPIAAQEKGANRAVSHPPVRSPGA
jgi:hypothetical protein